MSIIYHTGIARLPGGGMTPLLVFCDLCGAAVLDQDRHGNFHDRIDVEAAAGDSSPVRVQERTRKRSGPRATPGGA